MNDQEICVAAMEAWPQDARPSPEIAAMNQREWPIYFRDSGHRWLLQHSDGVNAYQHRPDQFFVGVRSGPPDELEGESPLIEYNAPTLLACYDQAIRATSPKE